MRILFRNDKESPKKGQAGMFVWESSIPQQYDQPKCDRSSEDFTKPKLSLANGIKVLKIVSKSKLQQKQRIIMDSRQQIIIDLATELNRVTTKVPGSQACIVVDDLCVGECTYFILKWSKELNSLKSKNINKVSNTERFRSCLEGLTISKVYVDQTLTEDQKDLLWWIRILQSLPKSSVCQEGSARVELLDLYSQWKRGQLNNMLPIMDLIMRTILKEKFVGYQTIHCY